MGWQVDVYHVDLPIMTAPMDSVMSPATAVLIGRLGGIGMLDLALCLSPSFTLGQEERGVPL